MQRCDEIRESHETLELQPVLKLDDPLLVAAAAAGDTAGPLRYGFAAGWLAAVTVGPLTTAVCSSAPPLAWAWMNSWPGPTWSSS